jgi:hypothetical protein
MSVPVVHEQVHQRAGQDQQPREDAKEMSPVLGDKKEPANDEEAEQRQPARLAPPGAVIVTMRVRFGEPVHRYILPM